MNYLPLDEIPPNKLPIYFVNAEIEITKILHNKPVLLTKSFKRVVTKGVDEKSLKKALKRSLNRMLPVKEQNYKVTRVELLKQLGFGVIES